MHRSGTSCLAGSLEEAGLELGAVITAAPHNKKGNRESPAIMALHDAVLAESGGSWENPPERVTWSTAQRTQLQAIIESHAAHAVWGFKCPRTLLTLDGWLDAIPELRFVGTFRHPLAVAGSLVRRNGGTLERWLELWSYYNSRLLQYHARFGFPMICFDLEPAEYESELRRVIDALELSAPAELRFFDHAL